MTPNTDKTALVTGGGRGIGSATAIELAKQGVLVYINYLTSEAHAKKTQDRIHTLGGRAELIPFDIADPKQCDAAMKSILSQTTSLDILVNNAGLKMDRVMAMMKADAWTQVINTNLTGFYNLTKPVVKQMLKNHYGRIVNVTSTAGVMGNAGQVNYSASKAGLIGATKALAREVASRNITVNAVAPGFIDTDMLSGMDKDEMIKTIPAGRLGTAEEVAATISFLCSDKASYINGQVIGINGGMI